MKPARMLLIIFLLSLLVGCAGMKKEDTAVQSGESATEPVSRENESTSPESVTAASEETVIPSSVTPTGYPRGQVQRQLLFYRGVLWGRDTDDGSMKTQVPDGFAEAAMIAKNDNFKAPAELPRELERNLQINENVLRYLVVKLEEKRSSVKPRAAKPAPVEAPSAEAAPAEEAAPAAEAAPAEEAPKAEAPAEEPAPADAE